MSHAQGLLEDKPARSVRPSVATTVGKGEGEGTQSTESFDTTMGRARAAFEAGQIDEGFEKLWAAREIAHMAGDSAPSWASDFTIATRERLPKEARRGADVLLSYLPREPNFFQRHKVVFVVAIASLVLAVIGGAAAAKHLGGGGAQQWAKAQFDASGIRYQRVSCDYSYSTCDAVGSWQAAYGDLSPKVDAWCAFDTKAVLISEGSTPPARS